jgi:hypothetical protein
MSNVMRARNPLHRLMSGFTATTVAKVHAREGRSAVTERSAPHARSSSLCASDVPLHRGVHRCPAAERARVALGNVAALGQQRAGKRSGNSVLLRRAPRFAPRRRLLVRAHRLSPRVRCVACAGSAFVGGAAHNRSLERTPDGAAQLQRYAPA